MTSTVRVLIILMLFSVAFAGMRSMETIRPVPIKKSLAQFPERIGEWSRVNQQALDAKVVDMLGVDDYIEYDYQAPDGTAVNLYVSYFSAVGLTGSYHSPRNCLPGGGWQVAEVATISLPDIRSAAGPPIVVNSLVVQKGTDKQKFIYWFQNRGRIIASEYWEKIYSVLDAISMRRRDGSYIRVTVTSNSQNEREMNARAEAFVQQVISTLEEFLPGEKLD